MSIDKTVTDEKLQYLSVEGGASHFLLPSIAKELLDARSEILTLREESRWIPVCERLPEVGEPVLCGWQYDSISIMNLHIETGGHKYWQNNSGIPYAFESVTHWRPLPQPPEQPE